MFIFRNGDKTEGLWINGMAKIKYSNGDRYEGEIKDGSFEKHGKGVLIFKDGSRYEGRWVNGKYNENGMYASKGNGRVCEEIWKSGSLQQTIMTCADGTQYKAKWEKVKNGGKSKTGMKSK